MSLRDGRRRAGYNDSTSSKAPTARTIPIQQANPRRPPAHKSVSLLHVPASRSQSPIPARPRPVDGTSSPNTVPKSDKANPPSTDSSRPSNNHQSSGESSDAGKWFENSNNNVAQSGTSLMDNDPPFFLRNSSSSDDHVDKQYERTDGGLMSTSLPHRPGVLSQLKAEESSTDDFRSVIDDLTVANKKLKRKLKKYEKLYDAHLQGEKLFEVRFHGLSAPKKKELEDVLQKFALDVDETPTGASGLVLDQYPATLEKLDSIDSSHASTKFAESGYVSMAASGQNSASAPSAQESNDRNQSKAAFDRNQQNVQSYLQDIPPGLMPKHTVVMTEKAKKKLVVRRLEQIFAGKASTMSGHQQPQQQEEVAQSAAKADRIEKEASGQRTQAEGLREARIMPFRSADRHVAEKLAVDPINNRVSAVQGGRRRDGFSSPDQRPTRPLDLDPHRAQIPADNFDYFRHLGFSPPEMDEQKAQEGRHGWLYLNLLVNLAQLHTINVTTDFVKNALTEFSSKLELSPDGRKVRWRGGPDVSLIHSDSSSEHTSNVSPESGSAENQENKRLKTRHLSSTGSRKKTYPLDYKEGNKFNYTPLFFHKEESEEDDSTPPFISSTSSPHVKQAGNSSEFESSGMVTSSSKRKRDDGPIIFYTKAKFCTDLSGDRSNTRSVLNSPSYNSLTTHPVGSSSEISKEVVSDESRGPLTSTVLVDEDEDPMEVDDDGDSDHSDFQFSPKALQNSSTHRHPPIIPFEVSGIGGVQPQDNFAINVQCQRIVLENDDRIFGDSNQANPKRYPSKILKALQVGQHEQGRTSPHIAFHIISATRQNLPASKLPPASFYPFGSTSGDADSDLESENSESASVEYSPDMLPLVSSSAPAVNLSPHSGDQEETSEEEEEDDDDEDDEVDLLATARKLDPEAVRAQELEYDTAIAERLAEDIPAGSSAATAGGGSGYNTPRHKVAGEEDPTTKRISRGGSGSQSGSGLQQPPNTRLVGKSQSKSISSNSSSSSSAESDSD